MTECCDSFRYFGSEAELPMDAPPVRFCPWCGAPRPIGSPEVSRPERDPDAAAIARLERIATGTDPRWDPISKAAAEVVWAVFRGVNASQIERAIGRLSDRFHERLRGDAKP